MKHNTPELMKFKRLQRRLGCSKVVAVGTLELLWIETARNCPQGDIGRYSDEEIAIMCDWNGPPEELVAALAETGWIDACDEHRLVIHDWATHCPKWVKGNLAKHGKAAISQATIASCPKQAAIEQTQAAIASCLEQPAIGETQATRRPLPPYQTKPNHTNSIYPSDRFVPTSEGLPEPADPPNGVLDFAFPMQSDSWWMPAKKLAEYTADYPWPVEPELRKAAAWLRENRKRRPRSPTGVKQFLTRWLNRHDDDLRNRGSPDKDADIDAWIDSLDLGEEDDTQ